MAANIFEKLSEMFSSLKADDGDDEEEEEEEVLFDAQHAFGHHSNVSWDKNEWQTWSTLELYCPQSFSGGGLYWNANELLLWSLVSDNCKIRQL